MIKSYKRDFDYTYTLGVFETIEALHNKPEYIKQVYLHSSADKNKGVKRIEELCELHHIPLEIGDKVIARVSKKSNCFAIAVLDKYLMQLEDTSHVMLVNPGDMGNIGTILRTMLGFGYHNLAIIKPGVDVFDPRVLRASMGAIFKMNVVYFDSFEEYQKEYGERDIYTLMLKGATNMYQITPEATTKHTLIFGNESSGLPDTYLDYGKSIFIPHNAEIDSLNLSMAVGISLAYFSKDTFLHVESVEKIY